MALNNRGSGGFTLSELSVVLVVIGFIILGAVSANNLIKIAKMRSLVADIDATRYAIAGFKLQYNALPGDFKDAFDHFGAQLSCSDELAKVGGSGCNGNFDRMINWQDEGYRSWQHLAAAELFPGKFSGFGGGKTLSEAVVGANVPELPLESVGMSIFYVDKISIISNFDKAIGQNVIAIGKESHEGSLPLITRGGFATPKEAKSIDNKIDDGEPGNGMLMTDAENDTKYGCATSFSAYNTEIESKPCSLIVRIY